MLFLIDCSITFDLKFNVNSKLNEYRKLHVSEVKVIIQPTVYSKSLRFDYFQITFSPPPCGPSQLFAKSVISHEEDGHHIHK